MSSFNAQNQNYYEKYTAIAESFNEDYKHSKRLTDSLIASAKKANKNDDVANIANDFSLVAYYKQEIKDAQFYSKLSISTKESSNTIDDIYAISLQRLGAYFYGDGNYDQALKYYKKVIEVNLVPRSVAKANCGIGSCYYLLNDYYKSVNYYKTGIKQLEDLDLKYDLINEYINSATVFSEINTTNSLHEQLETLKKLEALGRDIELYPEDYLSINNSYAVLYSNTLHFDFKLASHYSKLNLELANRKHHNVYKCTSYINLADVHNIKMKDSALYFANQAISKCETKENISKGYLQKSTFFKNQKDYISALKDIQTSINTLIETDLEPTDDVQLKHLKTNTDKDHLLFLYVEKNKLLSLQSKKENNISYSEIAIQHILVEDSLVDLIQSETISNSKLHWRLKASEIYTQGVELCYDLNRPETAFYLLEKGKALLLTKDIVNNEVLSKLPDSIKAKESELKKIINTSSSQQKGNQKFKAELDYEKYLDSIKVVYPQYFKNQSLQSIITLTELREDLDNKTVIISYLWPNSDIGNNTVFALFISKNKTELLKIGNAKKINTLLTSYRKLISKPLTTKKDRTEFNEIAYQLHYTLLQPENIQISIKGKDLIIIPDGKLHNIPYEALTTEKGNLDYLIKENTISYAYSVSFLEQNKSIERHTNNDFVGFAPKSFNALNLSPLENSISEINKASSIANGTIFIDSSATKSSFLNNASNSKIIHLATHADASGNPWIAFTDKKLNLQELYTFKNNADLTVLSSCNTSLGEVASGEGVMSLARGFFYSGSKSVIASLWTVNDKSTSFLMEDFYKNLKNGETKSEALRHAKLNYINSHSLSEASPYYWSSFVLLGDTGVVELQNDNSILLYSTLALIILLLLIILYIKKPHLK